MLMEDKPRYRAAMSGEKANSEDTSVAKSKMKVTPEMTEAWVTRLKSKQNKVFVSSDHLTYNTLTLTYEGNTLDIYI